MKQISLHIGLCEKSHNIDFTRTLTLTQHSDISVFDLKYGEDYLLPIARRMFKRMTGCKSQYPFSRKDITSSKGVHGKMTKANSKKCGYKDGYVFMKITSFCD